MTRAWRQPLLALASLLVALLANCNTPEAIVLWHAYAGRERAALEQTAALYNQSHGDVPLVLVALPYDGMADKLASAIPNGNGPDLFIYPHDRLGAFVTAGNVMPIGFWLRDADIERFDAASLATTSAQGTLWGLPVASKTMALYVRDDRFAAGAQFEPASLEALFAADLGHRDDNYTLGYLNADLYGHAPFLHAFGGGTVDGEQLQLNSPGAVAAAEYAAALVRQRKVPAELDGPQLASLFNSGKIAAAIGGPWFAADIAPGVAYHVTTLPTVLTQSGAQRLAPFVGTDAIMVAAGAKHRELAAQAMLFLTSDQAATHRALGAAQVVPNHAVYQAPELAAQRTLFVFRQQMEHGVPMPHSRAMRVTWSPYKNALSEILAGNLDAATALRQLEQQVKGYAAP